MDNGWIKLHRKLLNNPLWKDCNANQKVVMITLLLMANHAPNKWMFKGEEYEVQAGQFITSLASISEEAGVTPRVVRTCLVKFENADFLTSKATNKNRLITIKNWGKYQMLDNQPVNQEVKDKSSTGQAPVKHRSTNKNDKNNKNDKEYIYRGQSPMSEALNFFKGKGVKPTTKELADKMKSIVSERQRNNEN